MKVHETILEYGSLRINRDRYAKDLLSIQVRCSFSDDWITIHNGMIDGSHGGVERIIRFLEDDAPSMLAELRGWLKDQEEAQRQAELAQEEALTARRFDEAMARKAVA